MIKAVCFDFFNTLAHYDPSREEVYVNVCSEFGIKVEAKALAKSLPAADMYWRNENSRSPIDKRPEAAKIAFWAEYTSKALRGAGAEVTPETALRILARLRQFDWKFKAYADSVPALKELKNRGLILGLISNAAQDMESTYQELGLQPYLTFKVTSSEVGYDKPRPEIFLAALKKAQVKPREAIYVGDQYDLDVVGARGVGMKAVLIDRSNYFTDIADCPRIRSLTEIVEYVQPGQK